MFSQPPLALPTAELWELPLRLRPLVEAELAAGERLLWLGQPQPRRFAQRSLPLVLFGIPWTAFAIFWTCGAAGFQIPDFRQPFQLLFPLFGVPFILVGLGMLSSPYWMIHKARHSAYALTDRRAIVFDGGLWTTIRSFSPERLDDLRRVQRADGSGDLIFERKISHNSEGDRHATDIGFLAIANVKAVEDLVCRMIEAATDET